jgi:CubicO group peptidase (beta-lactamase class C family)
VKFEGRLSIRQSQINPRTSQFAINHCTRFKAVGPCARIDRGLAGQSQFDSAAAFGDNATGFDRSWDMKNQRIGAKDMDKTMLTKVYVAACLAALVLGVPARGAETAAKAILGKATYTGLERERFMTKWLLLGPVPIGKDPSASANEQEQKKAFGIDPFSTEQFQDKVKIEENQYEWTAFTSPGDTVDLTRPFGETTYVTAYAWACLDMVGESRTILGIGSDDAVKVWLNGKLIHENWVQRGCTADNDLVPVTFRRGRNHLVLKVQNGTGDWAFSCRAMGQTALIEKLVSSVQSGQLDPAEMLLEQGVDVNGQVGPGLTALHGAKIAGRDDAVQFLLARGADPKILMPSKERMVNWLFEHVIKEGYPGAAILVAQNGRILYQNGYGYADIGNRVRITPETKFRIGSVTKQFTAAAILKLQEDGRLSVDDKLSKYYPDFPRGDEITLYHLLTHTSGLANYTSKPDFLKKVMTEATPAEIVDSIKKDKPDFNPGEKWEYCNSGYFLLGCIVEKVSGQSLAAFFQETFFDPLGMRNTGMHHWNRILDHEATGYSYLGGKVQRSLDWDMSWAGGAGALYSTVGDLYRWNDALFNGKVLTAASLEAAFTPAKLKDGKVAPAVGQGYGFGWIVGKLRGLTSLAHDGGLHGFVSYLMQLPEQKFTVAVLANNDPPIPELTVTEFSRRVAQIYLYEKMEPQRSVEVDKTVAASTYEDYAGEYQIENVGTAKIVRENEHLYVQVNDQPRIELFPRTVTEFFLKIVQADITFTKDTEGKVTSLTLKQSGTTLTGQKVK